MKVPLCDMRIIKNPQYIMILPCQTITFKLPSGVYITMENHQILMGKSSTISMVIFNSYGYVSLPEGNHQPTFGVSDATAQLQPNCPTTAFLACVQVHIHLHAVNLRKWIGHQKSKKNLETQDVLWFEKKFANWFFDMYRWPPISSMIKKDEPCLFQW